MRLKQYLLRRRFPELVGHELVGQAPLYVTEALSEKDIEDVTYHLEKECSQILKVYKKRWKANENRPILWRGVGNRELTILKKKSHIKDRKPMSTGADMHNWLNTQFQKQFGWPVRNGVGTSGERNQSSTYGKPYIFFPLNNFKFAWSPKVWDLWSDIEKHMPMLNKSQSTLEIPPKYGPEKNLFKEKIEPLLDHYTNKNLDKAIGAGKEVFFNTPEYYLLDAYSNEGGKNIMFNIGLTGN
jgi:hypothetical protein